MAIRKISEFVSAVPTSKDKILFEHNGAGKSATFGDVGELIGLDKDLLWTNESPTSEFAPQEINLGLSKYKFVYIIIRYLSTDASLGFVMIPVTGECVFATAYYNNAYVIIRKFYVQSSLINIRAGGLNGSTNNSVAIPYQIYGVK